MRAESRSTSWTPYCFGAHSSSNLTSEKALFEGISPSTLNITPICSFFGLPGFDHQLVSPGTAVLEAQ